MSRYYNRTRSSASTPARLIREGKWHLLPLYYLLLTSDLAKEGIEHSGSPAFADHIYGNVPSGRYGIGPLLDAVLLALASAKALRARYAFAKHELRALLAARASRADTLDILAVPCGFAREMFEVAGELGERDDHARRKVRWYGIDLDPDVVAAVARRTAGSGAHMEVWMGDALVPATYRRAYDMVISTGFTEFLDDHEALAFYRTVRAHLRPGGRFVTSGMRRHAMSDYLLRNLAEIHTSYRDAPALQALAREAGFAAVSTYGDRTGLQTMLVAVTEVSP